MSKRKCIFTGLDSDFKLKVSEIETHNWAREVPCTKKYWNEHLKDRHLNEVEMRLVELFYQKELSILRLENYKKQIEEAQELLQCSTEEVNLPFTPQVTPQVTDQDTDQDDTKEKCSVCDTVILDAPGIGPFCPNKDCVVSDDIDLLQPNSEAPKKLTKEDKDSTIKKKFVKKKQSLWD